MNDATAATRRHGVIDDDLMWLWNVDRHHEVVDGVGVREQANLAAGDISIVHLRIFKLFLFLPSFRLLSRLRRAIEDSIANDDLL